MMILLTAMSVLLPLLAALQYYWLGQVSEGATDRLQISLRAGATRFRQDFNREFIRAYLNFHMDSNAHPADIERYHLDRLEGWNTTAPYPRLIGSVFVVYSDEHGRPVLSYLNANAKRLELTDWSGELVNLRDGFEKHYQNARSRGETSLPNSLESFAETVPALIIPFPSPPTGKAQPRNTPNPGGFTLIKLDLNYLQSEFIPSLMTRHFFDDSPNEYDAAVISLKNPERVIYSSRYPLVDFASSDVSTRVFGLEADELRAFLRSESFPGQLRLFNIRYLRGSSVVSSKSPDEEDGRWQLLIKHQAGSLQAAVSGAHRRNLAIGFSILLLLAASILMTAVSMRRAERLARQQINFVAGVTHELRTPLAVICSAGENLADGVVNSPAKVAQYGEVIHREGRRLSDMVEQTLEFAGAQSGRRRYEFRSTDVAEFIEGAVAACQAQIEENDFNVETVIDPNLPPVIGDRAALKRAMQNLISNAIKYDGKNRWARISAQTCADEHSNEVRITVEDRGLGIISSDLSHIFEPFYRGHEAVAAQIQGSGVGLSLVKQIAEAHGGRIRVKSRPGMGSAFTLYLPIASQATEVNDEVKEDSKS